MTAPKLSRACSLASLAVAGVLVVAGTVAADTIYLKSGRIIRTADARIEDDKVIFDQYGFEQSIPLSVVDRVEEDDYTGPEPLPAPPPEETPPGAQAEGGAEGEAGDAAGPLPAETPEIDTVEVPPFEEEVLPEETRQYWQEQMLALEAEERVLEEQLEWLRRVERAFLFSHRSTADVKRRIESVTEGMAEVEQARRDLREQARRMGIPPGWLRVRG